MASALPERVLGRASAFWLWLLAMAMLLGPWGRVAADETEVMAELNKLRGIQPTDDKEELDQLNKKTDSAWEFLRKNRAEAEPIVMRELRKELTQKSPDQFFVLDTAFFLISKDDSTKDTKNKEELVHDALEHVDPKAGIIQYNFLQLVKFTHALAKRGNPRVLPQIDRIFLGSERGVEFFEAPHYVKLPAQSIRVLLYGVTGTAAEDHLAKLLNEPGYEKHQTVIVALLFELGSERSVDAVKRVLDSRGDYEYFSMAVTMLMNVGGPSGRDAVVTAKTDQLDAKSRAYYERILPGVKAVSFERLAQAIKKFDGSDRVFDDAELSKRLEAYAKSGVDDETNPSNVVNSGIPKDELLAHLKRIRSRTLWRLNQHALEDVHVTNQIINAVQYKP